MFQNCLLHSLMISVQNRWRLRPPAVPGPLRPVRSGPPEIPHSKSVPISLCPQSRRCGISPLVAPQAPAANWVSSLDAVGATSQRKWSMIRIEACLVASGTRLRSRLRLHRAQLDGAVGATRPKRNAVFSITATAATALQVVVCG
jgi:hypothetical protein